MLKKFTWSCRRFYGELRDDFHYETYAESRFDALLDIVADLNDIYADSKSEAEGKQKAMEWLDGELGTGWTVDVFLNANLALWKDYVTCYVVHNIREVENPKHERNAA